MYFQLALPRWAFLLVSFVNLLFDIVAGVYFKAYTKNEFYLFLVGGLGFHLVGAWCATSVKTTIGPNNSKRNTEKMPIDVEEIRKALNKSNLNEAPHSNDGIKLNKIPSTHVPATTTTNASTSQGYVSHHMTKEMPHSKPPFPGGDYANNEEK